MESGFPTRFDGNEIVADSIDRPAVELAVYPALGLRSASKHPLQGSPVPRVPAVPNVVTKLKKTLPWFLGRCISQPTEHPQILLQRLGLNLPTALERAAM